MFFEFWSYMISGFVIHYGSKTIEKISFFTCYSKVVAIFPLYLRQFEWDLIPNTHQLFNLEQKADPVHLTVSSGSYELFFLFS